LGDSFEITSLGSRESPVPIPKPAADRAADANPAAAGRGAPEQTRAPIIRPAYYWTWRLMSQGFQAEECLAIRGITRETLLDHLLQAVENGLEIRLDWCLSAKTITALKTVIGVNPPKQIRPLLAQLPPGTQYVEVQIYLKCRSS